MMERDDVDRQLESGSRWGGMAIAAGVGALVGAGVALLYAPRSGRETREVLRDKADQVKQGANRVADAVKSGTQQAVDTARQTMQSVGRTTGEPMRSQTQSPTSRPEDVTRM